MLQNKCEKRDTYFDLLIWINFFPNIESKAESTLATWQRTACSDLYEPTFWEKKTCLENLIYDVFVNFFDAILKSVEKGRRLRFNICKIETFAIFVRKTSA